jgi:hypothetical protein
MPHNAARPATTSTKVGRPRDVSAARIDVLGNSTDHIIAQELAAHVLAARFHLPLARAMLIADLAGFGGRAA